MIKALPRNTVTGHVRKGLGKREEEVRGGGRDPDSAGQLAIYKVIPSVTRVFPKGNFTLKRNRHLKGRLCVICLSARLDGAPSLQLPVKFPTTDPQTVKRLKEIIQRGIGETTSGTGQDGTSPATVSVKEESTVVIVSVSYFALNYFYMIFSISLFGSLC